MIILAKVHLLEGAKKGVKIFFFISGKSSQIA
jgi:hypothetical protein